MPPCASRQVRGPATESSHRLLPGLLSALWVPLLFASLPPLPPVLSPLPFFPRSRNNFVKSARRRRNDEGGTTALRGGLYTSLARPQAPRPSNSLSIPFSISRVKPPPAVLLSHPRRRRGARARCVLPLCSPPVRSVLSPYLLLSPSRILFPSSSSHARDLFRIRACCARPVLLARSLARPLRVRACSVAASTRPDAEDDTLCRASVRSLARLLAIIVVFFVGTSAHSYPLARVLSQDES